MHATVIAVPCVMLIYNLIMHGVNKFDQIRASYTTAMNA